MSGETYLPLVHIHPDEKSHILIKNTQKCKNCDLRSCLYICPSDVFNWDESKDKIDVLWCRCVECGACEPACPDNVEYNHPRGGFGVSYLM